MGEAGRSSLVLGPLVRHVDAGSAAIWVETGRAGTVRVCAGSQTAEARTFRVHGHHYALVTVGGLKPGSKTRYTVDLDEERLWPAPDSAYPPSMIVTVGLEKPLRIAFGSCRTSVPHDAHGNRSHGVDALRAFALRMAGVTECLADDPDGTRPRWPDLVLFLGDQVYADITSEEMREFIATRRDLDEPPGTELADYEEYAHLYRLAWSDPVNRWLLSTLPSAMIFDDHDIRDDWNTSAAWRTEMEATTWWHERIVAGLASYWVYQHLGNLSPAERSRDEIWRVVEGHDGEDEVDISEVLDAFADRVDRHPESYRWSYAREFGSQARLVVVDSRAARVLEPQERALLDDSELAWLDEQLRGDVDHVLVGTSLPFLLASGLHHMEAFSEAVAGGVWGKALSGAGERMRRGMDLEHWAAFQRSFHQVATMVIELAAGQRGRAPRTVTFLSGDVHHSYLSEARPNPQADGHGAPALQSRIIQAVCSPIRNPLPRAVRYATGLLSYAVAGPVGRLVARSAKVPDPPLRWTYTRGPWFDNNLAILDITPDGLRIWWARGEVEDDRHDIPRMVRVADLTIE